ncbi:MAG TPA: glycosyl hydrolase family 28-related protein [Polyangiaceae bacterium]|nr:glycosyl hydrolase family 28-related protein [Polyangiaceae bacterium]
MKAANWTSGALLAVTLASLAACGESAPDEGDAGGGSGGASATGGSVGAGGSLAGAPGSGGGDVGPQLGATVPFFGYEAEDGSLGGGATVVSLDAPPTTRFSSPQLEASAHAFVSLDATGEYVEWTNDTGQAVTFFNLRASIPDAAAGRGIDAELDLLVDGVFRQKVKLSSRQTWGYEGNDHYNAQTQDPADGNPRTFWDDFHAFLAGEPLAPGAKLRLVKSADNSAAFYHIDLIELETPPPPTAQPAGSLSVLDFGAVADNPSIDNSEELQAAIDAAETQGKTLFLPPGTFYFARTGGLDATGITIEGAGMWYSRLYRAVPLPNGTPLGAVLNLDSCQVRNFAIDANAIGRDSVDGGGGGMDTTGTNWSADGIWTQHTMSGFWASGEDGSVRNCRLLSIWADGCNVNNVSRGASVGRRLLVENNFVRGTGDDAIAINSVDYNDYGGGNIVEYEPMEGVIVRNNTSVAMWGGKGVSIYGGRDHTIEWNLIHDCARYIGLGVGKFGANGSDLESAVVRDNVVIGCGGNAYEQQQPALHIGNGGDGHSTGNVGGVLLERNRIVRSIFNAVGFSTSHDIEFIDNQVEDPGLDGIVVNPPFYPAPEGSALLRGNSVKGLGAGRIAYQNLSAGYQVTLEDNDW